MGKSYKASVTPKLTKDMFAMFHGRVEPDGLTALVLNHGRKRQHAIHVLVSPASLARPRSTGRFRPGPTLSAASWKSAPIFSWHHVLPSGPEWTERHSLPSPWLRHPQEHAKKYGEKMRILCLINVFNQTFLCGVYRRCSREIFRQF